MVRVARGLLAAMAAGAVFVCAPTEAEADDPAFISFAGGAWDWNRQKDSGAEFRLEYRSDEKFWHFKPFAALAGTTTGSAFVSAGILLDVYFGTRFVVTPSFAPGYYHQGSAKLDLGHELEFRSQLEFAYRFDDRSRLGVAISHYSNASIGDTNPGTESAMLYYSIPLEKITGAFR